MAFLGCLRFGIFVVSLFHVILSSEVDDQNDTFLVGLITPPQDNVTNIALDFIRKYVNAEIMPDKWTMEFKLQPEIGDAGFLFDVTGSGLYKIADGFDKLNVSAFIGPGSSTQTKLIHAFACSRELPHISPFSTDPALGQSFRFPMLVRLSPPDTFQTKAVFDILQFYGWNRVSLITTDNDYGFGARSALLEIAATRRCKVDIVKAFQVLKNADQIAIESTLDKILTRRPHPVVVVTGSDYGKVILKAAYLRGMTVRKNWLWLLMDGVAVDDVLKVVYTGEQNKTTTRWFDGLVGTRPVMSEGKLRYSLENFWKNREHVPYPWTDGFGYGLEKTIDAIVSVAHGFRSYHNSPGISQSAKVKGKLLRDAILRVKTDGMTSYIEYKDDGRIHSTKYDILVSDKGEWKAIGDWSDSAKLNVSYALAMNYSKSLRNADPFGLRRPQAGKIIHPSSTSEEDKPILHVVTIAESPFIMIGKTDEHKMLKNRVYTKDLPETERKQGMNVVLHGYCIDMLEKLSETAGFRYTLRLIEDSAYGAYDVNTGVWNGMIGSVLYGQAHVAVAPITVTQQRAEYVDFTTSFMDIGLKYIVDRKAANEEFTDENDAFAFLLPFHGSLWFAIVVCVFCLALFLSLLARVSPYGTRGHFFLGPRIDQFHHKMSLTNTDKNSLHGRDIKQLVADKEDADRAMGFNNALYFVWASLFWQTPERVPRAPSSRIVTAVWYLAAVVFVASYTAKMVAFVSSQSQSKSNLDSVSELVSQTRIPYGTVADSSVEFILKSSGIKLASHIYDFIMSDPSNLMVPTSNEGFHRVQNGSYALLWDSLAADFEAAKSECRLKTVDVGFGGVVYSLAVQKRSPLTSLLSRHILRLHESGFLSTLWKRYFGELEKCYEIDRLRNSDELRVRRLEFSNLAGVFYLVTFAMGVGIVLLGLEWLSAGFFDVNKNVLHAPHTINEAIRMRFQRLKQDIVENWWPVEDMKKRFSKIELPVSDLAMSVVSKQVEKKKAKRTNIRSRLTELRGYSSESDLTSRSDKRKQLSERKDAKHSRVFSVTRSLSIFHSKSRIFPFHPNSSK